MTLNTVKGFLDNIEGEELVKIVKKCSNLGPCLEIGTYCGKSALLLGSACKDTNNLVFTIDHHTGSEEHQIGEEYHDRELYDKNISSFNTLPEFINNLRSSNLQNYILPIVGNSREISKRWEFPLGMVFIDGGHSRKAAFDDYESWHPHILMGGYLLIHDVFPNPNDGGRPPYEVFCEAKKSKNFEEIKLVKSLAILKKVSI